MLNRWSLAATAFSAIAYFSPASWADEAPRTTGSSRFSADFSEGATAFSIGLVLDYARILRLEAPAQTIVIGNPGIVDGTISDQHTVVLTGKAVGTTNLIVLGEEGRQISNLLISVASNDRTRVTIHNGQQQQTYSCIESCLPATSAGAGSKPAGQ